MYNYIIVGGVVCFTKLTHPKYDKSILAALNYYREFYVSSKIFIHVRERFRLID